MSEQLPRRRFLDLLLSGQFLALAAAILYPIARYLFPAASSVADPVEIRFGPASELSPNSARIVKMGSKPVLVLRTSDGQVRALLATCTHLNCTVQFRKEQGDVYCACHDGRYDLTGKNVGGPPPRPLQALVTEVRDGDLYVKRS